MTISTNTEALNASARATRAIHAGQEPDPTTGAVVTPIYMTSTFKQDGVGGLRNGYDYSRSINPTRNSFDEQLAAVEGAKYALSFSSGLAAIDVLLRSTLKPDDNILLGNDVYGGTYRLLSKVFVPWGIGLDVVDITDTAAVSATLAKKQYAYIWAETPSNPLLNITDIAATAAVAHAHGTKVVVDNTFASPVLQHPLADGADVVVYSSAIKPDNPELVRARALEIPIISRADMLAERSIRITCLAPTGESPLICGCPTATNAAPNARSCNSSRMFRRSRWNGALACRSSIDFFQSSVVEISTSRRRSFRKYRMISEGIAIAAAMPASHGVSHVIAIDP